MAKPIAMKSDPVELGQMFLENNAQKFKSETDTGVHFEDNFANLLILEATDNRKLVSLEIPVRTWNFFGGKPVLTTAAFPNDLDTTSLATTIIQRDPQIVQSLMDEMLTYANADGIIQQYYDRSRPRIEPEVCANILTFFHANSRGKEVQATFNWVYQILLTRAYNVSRYYSVPEPLFYYLSRLLRLSKHPEVQTALKPVLQERVLERIGKDTENAVVLAIRVLLCEQLGIGHKSGLDYHALLAHQEEDGSWGLGWIYKFGKSHIKIGNRGVTAALAVNAIKAKQGRYVTGGDAMFKQSAASHAYTAKL